MISETKKNIREYAEGAEVEIIQLAPEHGEGFKNVISKDTYESYIASRWIIKVQGQGCCEPLEIDLLDVIRYVEENMPKVWQAFRGL